SDAQILITQMEDRKKYTLNFSFVYFVENAELCGLFWADEVQDGFYAFHCYRHHRRCVTIFSVLLKNEITESYGWLLRAFMKAFVRALKIVVTNRDGAMRKTIDAEFLYSKDRICM
ncbi:FAR1-related sequence 5-like protein, partial [Tanacetum coccineum]